MWLYMWVCVYIVVTCTTCTTDICTLPIFRTAYKTPFISTKSMLKLTI